MLKYLVLTLLWFVLIGCGLVLTNNESKLHITIPAGYRGSFILIEDQNGIAIQQGDNVEIKIPESGFLQVKSLDPLIGSFQVIAVDSNGKTLSTDPTKSPSIHIHSYHSLHSPESNTRYMWILYGDIKTSPDKMWKLFGGDEIDKAKSFVFGEKKQNSVE